MRRSSRNDPPRKTMTVLLLEDHLSILENTARLLANSGFKYIRCSSVDRAIESFARRKTEIDWIVTDLNMNPQGLKEELIPLTDCTYLTGWVWLTHCVYVDGNNRGIQTVICSDFIERLERHMESSSDEHERRVFAQVKLLPKNRTLKNPGALIDVLTADGLLRV